MMETNVTHRNQTGNIDVATLMTNDFAAFIYPFTVILYILIIFGILGNLLILFVYGTRFKRNNFRSFIMILAVIDLLCCSTILPGQVYINNHFFNVPEQAAWICKVYVYCCGTTQPLYALVFMLVAVDRYRRVCQPLRWQLKPIYIVWICFAMCGCSALLGTSAPVIFGIQREIVTIENANVTLQFCWKDDSYKNDKTLHLVNFSVNSMLLAIPTLVATVLYVFVVCVLLGKAKGYDKILASNTNCRFGFTTSLASQSSSGSTSIDADESGVLQSISRGRFEADVILGPRSHRSSSRRRKTWRNETIGCS